jgi:acyl-CoA thioester hydrolase
LAGGAEHISRAPIGLLANHGAAALSNWLGEVVRGCRIAVRVRWSEADPAGIVYYPNFFDWFALGTLELLRGWRVPFVELFRDEQVGLPVIEAHGRFLAPVLYDDELEIETVVAEVRTRAFRLEHTAWRGSERVGEGYEVRGWQRIDRERLREVNLGPIPADLAAWLRDEAAQDRRGRSAPQASDGS